MPKACGDSTNHCFPIFARNGPLGAERTKKKRRRHTMVQRGAERSGTARCGAIRSGAARHGVESGTLFAIVKKSENQAGMVVRTRGTEKARKIGAAPFSVWFHRRRRLPPKRRRWFQECAELESRLSPSPPPPWREDAKSRTMARRRGSPEEEEEEEKGLTESLDRERFVFGSQRID